MPKKLLKPQTMLVPLPALLVSSQWGNRPPNIITVAWSGIACSEPPMITVAMRKSRYSHKVIQESMEFVVNITTEKLIKETDYCGVVSGKDVNKFEKTGLIPIKGTKIGAPLIKECPINLECILRQTIPLGSHDLFIGEIVATHADTEYLDEHGCPDLNKLKPLIYCTKAHEYWGGLCMMMGKYGFSKEEYG